MTQGCGGEPLAQPSPSAPPSQTPENPPLWPYLRLWVSDLGNPNPQGSRQKRGCRDQNLPYGPTNTNPPGGDCAHKGFACFD